MLPQSRSRGIWLVHPDVEPLLPAVKFDEAAATPVPVYLPANGMADSPFATLMGRPVMPMMAGMEALGDKGDMIFADMSYYLAIYKEIQDAMSMHVYFDTNETAFRFVQRVDGGIAYQTPVTPENGTGQKSGFVTLAERA